MKKNKNDFFKIFHRKRRHPIIGPYTFCKFLGEEYSGFTEHREFYWMASFKESCTIPKERIIYKNKYPRICKRIKEYIDKNCTRREVKWKGLPYVIYTLSFDEEPFRCY